MQSAYYDAMAPFSHLLFANWDRFQTWQLEKLSSHLPKPSPDVRIIDFACDIGTQLVPLAQAGFTVSGIDSSALCVQRCRRELGARELRADVHHCDFVQEPDDMRWASEAFDVALLMDNYIFHAADDDEVFTALRCIRNSLKPGGVALVAFRAYDDANARPTVTVPTFYAEESSRRFVHQVWDWQDESCYDFHLYLNVQDSEGTWAALHFVGRYRPVPHDRLAQIARAAGFRSVELIEPERTQYHRWLLKAQA
ncbi:class I SAM-dependent methyltransferase [Ideonella sp. 4Y16]|uniref:Class I SAM-dependent methyltransferase n=1 Tax=Ideonella alba TaxID=2824118 RepID=A0A940YFD8_9BURK|nr:class I SAM-dependent methyltransferase [Ideonella alba]MBQ0933550.1 class I SAM-dependent methyltransferase [Ideonella alba]MBQ0946561.1 class I SAM-dependent methyltransferase [Ideonella alba]